MKTEIIEKNNDTSRLFDVTMKRTYYWTTDYDQFSFLRGNRVPSSVKDQRHIKEIMNNLLRDGWWGWSHLLVNERKVILDGQYRMWALLAIRKETGKIFNISYELQDMSLEQIRDHNRGQMSWRTENYILSNITLGLKDYQFVKDLMTNFKFGMKSVKILCDNCLQKDYTGILRTEDFNSGKFKLKSEECKQDIWNRALSLEKLKPYISEWNNYNFIAAITFFFENKKKFDFERFLHKVETFPSLFKPQVSIAEYKRIIQFIYNYHCSRNEKITFIQA